MIKKNIRDLGSFTTRPSSPTTPFGGLRFLLPPTTLGSIIRKSCSKLIIFLFSESPWFLQFFFDARRSSLSSSDGVGMFSLAVVSLTHLNFCAKFARSWGVSLVFDAWLNHEFYPLQELKVAKIKFSVGPKVHNFMVPGDSHRCLFVLITILVL